MPTIIKRSISLVLLCCLTLFGQRVVFFGSNFTAGGGGGSSINTTAVQHTKSAHNGTTVAFGSNLGAAHLAIVAITDDGGALAISSVTATNNTYVLGTSCTIANGGARTVFVYYAKNTTAGAETVTVNVTSGTTGYINISEWSGASTTAPFDACATSNSGTSDGPITTSLSSELLMAVTVDTGDPATCSGYTLLDQGVFNTYNTIATVASGAAGSYTASGCPNNFPARALVAFK